MESDLHNCAFDLAGTRWRGDKLSKSGDRQSRGVTRARNGSSEERVRGEFEAAQNGSSRPRGATTFSDLAQPQVVRMSGGMHTRRSRHGRAVCMASVEQNSPAGGAAGRRSDIHV